MPATLDMPTETASDHKPTAPKTRNYDHLKQFHFKSGHAPFPKAGRPKGRKSNLDLLLQAAPKLTKHYIKRALKSDRVLTSAMDRIIPVDESRAPATVKIAVFVGDGILPRDPQPVVLPLDSAPQDPQSLTPSESKG